VTSMSGNPLLVAGPILLGVGAAMFFIVIVLVCVCNRRDQTNWETKVTNMALERTSSVSREPLVKDNPEPTKSAGPYDQPGRFSGSYDPRSSVFTDPRSSGVRGPVVQMLPNPAKDGKPHDASASFHDSSFDSNQDQVPAPLRVQKKRKGKPSENSSSGSVNHSYSYEIGEADLGIPGVFSPPRKSQLVKDGDMPGAYNNEVYESTHTQITKVTETRHTYESKRSEKIAGQQPKDGSTSGRAAVDPIRGAISRGASQEYPSQALRVHIKAQPSTAVHITPSSTPPRGGHPARFSVDSGETYI
jgi:hypothetical protein